jgi:Tol biopolymer transport system component
LGEPGEYHGLALAPDERRVALERHDPKSNVVDVWLMDMSTQVLSRFTTSVGFDAWAATAIWSPDGTRILFTDFTDRFHVKGLRGGQGDALVHGLAGSNWLLDWSGDGQHVLFQRSDPKTAFDLWVLPLSGDRQPFPYLNTSFTEFFAQVSPDGRWVAYVSDESGRAEVYLDAFPRAEDKLRISTNGGTRPRWRKDGQELYYLAPDRTLMAVGVAQGLSGVRASTPRPLFGAPQLNTATARVQYAVSGNGERFLFNALVEESNPRGITVLMNWPAALNR